LHQPCVDRLHAATRPYDVRVHLYRGGSDSAQYIDGEASRIQFGVGTLLLDGSGQQPTHHLPAQSRPPAAVRNVIGDESVAVGDKERRERGQNQGGFLTSRLSGCGKSF
jgi:hypothetical protein